MNIYESIGKIVEALTAIYLVGIVFSYGLLYEPEKL